MAVQKKRAKKTSQGINGGGGKVRGLGPVFLTNMGKGGLWQSAIRADRRLAATPSGSRKPRS